MTPLHSLLLQRPILAYRPVYCLRVIQNITYTGAKYDVITISNGVVSHTTDKEDAESG